jgi:hypothetical protein
LGGDLSVGFVSAIGSCLSLAWTFTGVVMVIAQTITRAAAAIANLRKETRVRIAALP